MKITPLILLSLAISTKSLGQDSLWKKNEYNKILTLNLPINSEYIKSSFVKVYGGNVNKNLYGFQYLDTISLPIENETAFQISLTAFISARVSDPKLKKYHVTVVDTSIGRTKGLMANFQTNDTSEIYKQIYFYVTLANNQYYSFYAYSQFMKSNDEEINLFFKSIIFDSEKLKEKQFKLTHVHLEKNAD